MCEPVQPTYFDVLEMASNKAGGIAVSPILRAYEDRGLESSTDFLSVRVYLRSETTRSMGLGYRCGWRVQDVGLLLCWPERFNLSTLTVIDFLVHLALPVGTPLSSTEPYSLALGTSVHEAIAALVRAKVS